MHLRRLVLPAAVAAAVLLAACGSDSEPQGTLKLPDSDTPASWICAEAPEGDAVTFVLNADVPSPRCSKIEAGQRVELANSTGGPARVQLAPFDLTLAPGERRLLDLPAGKYLAPGVHVIRVSSLAGGPELWLVGEDVLGSGATPAPGGTYPEWVGTPAAGDPPSSDRPLPPGLANGDIIDSGGLLWFIWENTKSRIWMPYAGPDGFLESLQEGPDVTGRLVGVTDIEAGTEIVVLTSSDFKVVEAVFAIDRAAGKKYPVRHKAVDWAEAQEIPTAFGTQYFPVLGED